MKKFVSGMLVGTAITVAALAGVATTIKTVIDPIEEKDMIEETVKRCVNVLHVKIAVTLR